MPLLNSGRNFIATAIINSGPPTFFDNSNAYLAVGDSTAAYDATHTNLQGTNKFRAPMSATYPTISTNLLTFRSLYTTTEANFAWDEWGVANHVSAGTLLNRKREALGTKASTQSWQLTAELTLNLCTEA